jgi:hypothetical protein
MEPHKSGKGFALDIPAGYGSKKPGAKKQGAKSQTNGMLVVP